MCWRCMYAHHAYQWVRIPDDLGRIAPTPQSSQQLSACTHRRPTDRLQSQCTSQVNEAKREWKELLKWIKCEERAQSNRECKSRIGSVWSREWTISPTIHVLSAEWHFCTISHTWLDERRIGAHQVQLQRGQLLQWHQRLLLRQSPLEIRIATQHAPTATSWRWSKKPRFDEN
jgi:hypothetical protein